MNGFIYFIRGGEFVKIGFSREPGKRLRDLTTSSPFDLTIIASHPGTKRDETSLHKWLAAHHKRGEWFYWHPDIEQIALLGLPNFNQPSARPISHSGAKCSHPLQEFRERARMSRAEFAKRLQVSEVALWRWECGKRFPRGRILGAIKRETGGLVTPNDFIEYEAAE